MRSVFLKYLLAFGAVQVLSCVPAHAQATRTWISGVGDDANPCSRTAPCKTFAGAISKTASGGEINVLDPGGFGGLTITKPITLRSDGNIGSVLVSGTNGIIINAGDNDRVAIIGLEIEGIGSTGSSGLSGIKILNAGDVLVRDVQIRDFTTVNSAGVDILSASKVRVTIDHTLLYHNTVGVNVNAAGGGHAKIFNSQIIDSSGAAVRATGASNDALLANVQVAGGGKALDLVSGGTAKSYGNNVLPNGDAPVTVPLN